MEKDPYIILQGQKNLPDLKDYQYEIKRELTSFLRDQLNGERSTLMSLPTGAGKTRTAVESIHHWMKIVEDENEDPSSCNLVVWVAQTDELCEQAFEEFCEMWKVRPHSKKIKLVRLWGGIYNDNVMAIARSIESLAYPVILITTNQTLKNLFSKTCFDEFVDKTYLAHTILSHIDLLVIDEAHHASANTYQYILDRICEYQSQEKLFKKQCKFLGMTATPFRNEDNPVGNLQKIFSKIIFPFRTLNNKSENPDSLSLKNELQKQNILAQEEYLTWNTDFRVKIENEKDYENEFATQIDKSLGRHHRRILIAQKIEELFKQEDNPLILYFGATVDDAKMISCLLNMKNIDAALVTGLTTPV